MMEIKSISWFDERFYKITMKDGSIDYFPSVTTKLGALPKPYLSHWRGDIGNREADLRILEASNRGSRIHLAWQVFVKGGAIIYQPYKFTVHTQEELTQLEKDNNGLIAIIPTQDEMLACYKMQQWWEVVRPTLIESEQTVYSLTNREAGTLDTHLFIEEGEYLINGKIPLRLEKGNYIHDLKTGKVIGNEAYMQVSAYLKFAEERSLGKFMGALITHTQAKTRSGIEGLSTIFLNRDDIKRYYEDYRNVAKVWDSQFGTLKPKTLEIPTIIKR